METRHKILVLDDDPDWLDVCREFLGQLPSQPEVRTAATGPRALSLLDTEPFRLFICDLKMPRMDGLQVLSIVRRRFPNLRTVVLTGLQDDEFRSRAYALGVDLFWLKPDVQQNSQMFLDCLESLLDRDDNGFRSTQSKSLVDIIQLECLSRSSTVLRITSGKHVARLWIKNGELIDAEAENTSGEAAFQRILKWKSGTFENLPAEPDHVRAINKSIEALTQESAQTIEKADNAIEEANHEKMVEKLATFVSEGVEFIVAIPAKERGEIKSWATQNPEQLAGWARHVEKSSRRLGELLSVGPLTHAMGSDLKSRVLLLAQDGKTFLVGWPPDMNGELLEPTKKIAAVWDS
jgi:CheY-like chemotaxis protein